MVVYVVSWKVKDGHIEKAKQLVQENFEHIKKEEQGNLAFATHQSKEDSHRFWMYEVWETQEAVDAHENSAWFKNQYKAQLKPIVEDDSIIFDNLSLTNGKGFSEAYL